MTAIEKIFNEQIIFGRNFFLQGIRIGVSLQCSYGHRERARDPNESARHGA
jgi:hypothetical protein